MTALASRQRRAVRDMLDRGVMRRATGDTTQDPETGTTVPEFGDLFSDRCKVVASDGLGAREVEIGGRTAVESSSILKLPASRTTEVRSGDRWVITNASAHSTCRVGQEFKILREVQRTHAKDRAFVLEEVLS